MICTTCKKETPDQQILCIHCGTVLNKECPRCAEIVKLKAKSCRFCNYEFSEVEVDNKPRTDKIPQGDAFSHGKILACDKTGNSSKPNSSTEIIDTGSSTTKKIFVIAAITIGLIVLIIVLIWLLPLITNKIIGIDSVVGRDEIVAIATETPLAATQATVGTELPLTATQATDATKAVAEPLESIIRFSPIAIESSDPSGGWIYHNVYFAVENQSNQWLPIAIDSGQGVVETKEGFNYVGNPIEYTSMTPLLYGEPIVIPPGFRIVGSTDNQGGYENVAQFQFSSADTTTPLRVNFSNYGAIDLVNVPRADLNVVIMSRIAVADFPFPTDQPRTSFSNMGDSIEIPNKARITFSQAYPSEYGIFAGVTIDVEFQNLNSGRDTTVNAGCYLIDGMGFIRWNQEETRFYAGPGQTNKTKLGFYLWNPSKAFYGDTDLDSTTRVAILSNAKLICRGDFEEIFNLDLR